jgi:hypothetical protein
MKATETLHDRGQSLWLDNITRDLLETGTLERYIDELSVTGLTSNLTIFDHAIKNSSAYDAAIRKKVKEGKSGEELFFELALEDLTTAADLFRPIWDRTRGVDGWVSLEVSPLLAHDTASTLVGCIILGRGEDDTKVREWLTTAAGVPGFIGFAVGRTDFWEPLIAWRAKQSTREDAIAEIARRYRQFVDIFERGQAA